MQKIYLLEKDSKVIRIKGQCGDRWNLGAICIKHAVLDLQNQRCRGKRYLIGEIAPRGNFTSLPGYKAAKNGATHCWSGSAYEGGAPFHSIGKGGIPSPTVGLAVKYLKKYFEVIACPENKTYKQTWIDDQ